MVPFHASLAFLFQSRLLRFSIAAVAKGDVLTVVYIFFFHLQVIYSATVEESIFFSLLFFTLYPG